MSAWSSKEHPAALQRSSTCERKSACYIRPYKKYYGFILSAKQHTTCAATQNRRAQVELRIFTETCFSGPGSDDVCCDSEKSRRNTANRGPNSTRSTARASPTSLAPTSSMVGTLVESSAQNMSEDSNPVHSKICFSGKLADRFLMIAAVVVTQPRAAARRSTR